MIKYLLIALALFPLVACQEESVAPRTVHDLVIIADGNKEEHFNVEIAITQQEQQTGLMHRTQMDEDAGMLFFFTDEAERGFWMKNTLLPLDLLFIKADGTIHHIHENAIPLDLTSIRSNGPVAAVLEINGGISKKLGLKAGNKVLHQFFKQNLAQ